MSYVGITYSKNCKIFNMKEMDFINESKNPMKKYILFVCLGNICRSPAAEGIMKQMVYDDAELRGDIVVDSAGIGNWHVGQLPDKRMREHAAARGYNLTSRARQICTEDFDRFDYIFAMDEQNILDLNKLARNNRDREKINNIADYITVHTEYSFVPDPYYGSGKDFDIALDLIEDACCGIMKKLKESIF